MAASFTIRDFSTMNAQHLIDTANVFVTNDKVLFAMDDSTQTCTKRFAALGISQTVEDRRRWRELIVTTPGLGGRRRAYRNLIAATSATEPVQKRGAVR
jgi:fructose-bisphosphate aldolase class 1